MTKHWSAVSILVSTLLSALVSMVVDIPSSSAHKPLSSADNNNFEQATVIPDPQVSWAIYQQLEGDEPEYYRFSAEKGDRLFVQMTVPDLAQYREFAPSLAIIGNGIDNAKLDISASSIAREPDSRDDGLEVASLPGSEQIVIDYNKSSPIERFYEPFTQTSYLERQEVIIDNLPSSGVYGLVVFNDIRSNQSGGGKYVLAVGEKESFSVTDYFTTLPASWFQTKVYFGDYLSVALVIVAIVGILALFAIIIMRRRARFSKVVKP